MLIIAAYIDSRTKLIPNWLVCLVAIAGLRVHFISHTLLASLIGLFIGSISIIGYQRNYLGAGDAKMFMALGLLMGPIIFFQMYATYICLYVWVSINKKKGYLKELQPLAPCMLTGFILMGGVVIAIKTFI